MYRKNNTSTNCTLVEAMGGLLDGVYRVDNMGHPSTRIAGAVRIILNACNSTNSGWGRLLSWKDQQGNEHVHIIKFGDLVGSKKLDTLATLADKGLFISTHRSDIECFINYLLTTQPEESWVLRTSDTVGWVEDSYLLPDRAYGQPVGYIGTAFDGYVRKGTLAEWQQEVAAYALGNSRLIFAISLSLLGPILRMLGMNSVGFHLLAQTSIGKSTALAVAASVHGDPAKMMTEWATTLNALEGTCTTRNDGFLPIDELGQCADAVIGSAAYLLANGHGKTRQSKTGENRPTPEWTLSILSCGEEDMEQKLARIGHQAKGGQQLRLLTLPGDAGKSFGLFEDLHDFESAAQFSDNLKRACTEFHGTALDHFMEALTQKENLQQVRNELHEYLKDMLESLELPGNLPPDAMRSAKNFAAVALAGELATLLGVTGWPTGSASDAAKQLCADWLTHRQCAGAGLDDRNLLRKIRKILEADGGSRFPDAKLPAGQLGNFRDRLGFTKQEDGYVVEYWVLPEQFDAEFLADVADKRQAKRMLIEHGWLLGDNDGHITRKRTLPTAANPCRVYVLSTKCLEDDLD